MALNIKSPRVDALAREVAALRNQSITEVVEAGLEALRRLEMEEREKVQEQRAIDLEALLARIDRERGPDLDPRPLKEIRDELWGGLGLLLKPPPSSLSAMLSHSLRRSGRTRAPQYVA